MDTSTRSALKIFCIGTVTRDNTDNEKVIMVNPSEHLPAQTGEINDSESTNISEGVDPWGNVYSDKTKSSTSIPCIWFDTTLGGLMPPTVRVGERVIVLREGDDNSYYWFCPNLDLNRRRHERVWLGASDVKPDEEGLVTLHLGNTYSVLFNTFNNTIRLGTAKSSGERWLHEIWLTETSVIIQDDIGQKIFLDSEEHIIRLINADESFYELNKKDIFEFCKGNKVSTIEGNLTENIKGNVTRNIDGDVTNSVKGNVNENHTDWTVTTRGSFNQKVSGGYKVDVATATFTGMVKMAAFTSGAGMRNAAARGLQNKVIGGLDIDIVRILNADITKITTDGIKSSGAVLAPNIK